MCDPLTDVERAMLQITGELERRLFVIAGPSGVGKNTIIKEVLANHPDVMDRVRTYTTRDKREDEVEGAQYYFVSKDEFKKLAHADRLMEADAENPLGHDVYKTQHSYSMPADIFEDVAPDAHLIIAEVDVVGARRLKSRFPDCVQIFITAPPHELLERIRRRRDEGMKDEDLEQRMQTAKHMVEAAKTFDYVVYNTEGGLTNAVRAIEHIIHAERMRTPAGFDLKAMLPEDAFDISLITKNGYE